MTMMPFEDKLNQPATKVRITLIFILLLAVIGFGLYKIQQQRSQAATQSTTQQAP